MEMNLVFHKSYESMNEVKMYKSLSKFNKLVVLLEFHTADMCPN